LSTPNKRIKQNKQQEEEGKKQVEFTKQKNQAKEPSKRIKQKNQAKGSSKTQKLFIDS
jgi:hypothetical protein